MRIKYFAISLLALLLSYSLNSKADFKQAVKDYQSGNYPAAMTEFQSLAEIGNTDAQYNLGMMYLDGLGTKQDLVKAYAWIKLSDEKAEDKETQEVLKEIEKYLKGKKSSQANSYFAEISDKYGRETIIVDLKPIFSDSLGTQKVQHATPIKTSPPSYPQKAQIAGIEGYTQVVFALSEVGSPIDIDITESYPNGVFDRESLKALSRWRFEVPKDYNNEKLSYKLQFMLGDGYSRKALSAIKGVKKEAINGDPVAQYLYAKYGPSILRREKINPTEWYYKSAIQGIADAQHEVGLNLINGKGCQSDKEKGLKWLISAASANLGRSQFELAKLYSKMDVEDSKQKTSHWLNKATESKDKDIAYELAQYMDKYQSHSAQQVLAQLELATTNSVNNPVRFYELLAKTHAELENYEKAVENQNQANKVMRRYGKVPQEMQQKLIDYKAKRDS